MTRDLHTLRAAIDRVRAMRPSTSVSEPITPEMRERLAYRRGINDALEEFTAAARDAEAKYAAAQNALAAVREVAQKRAGR